METRGGRCRIGARSGIGEGKEEVWRWVAVGGAMSDVGIVLGSMGARKGAKTQSGGARRKVEEQDAKGRSETQRGGARRKGEERDAKGRRLRRVR